MKDGKIQLDLGAVNQPRTLFKPGSWLAKIDFINHLILFNNVLITVLSEKEGGKTSFSTLLQNNLDQQIKSISMTVKPPCDRQNIIDDIAAQLHLNNDAETNIASIVGQINERKAHVLLIIDDAHHLPESFIKEAMIAIKNQEDFGFFHLCLVSDYSVVAALNNLAVEQFNNLIHTIELGALNESETRTYVLQRAMTARLINKPLTDAQFKQFFQLTKGNVAKINNNLETFVFKCSTQKQSNKVHGLKRTSVAALSVAVAAGVSYMYFNNTYNIPHNTQKPSELASNRIEIQDLVEKVNVQPNASQPNQLISQIASWQDSSTRQFVHYGLPKKQILDDTTIDEDESINTVAIVDKVVVIPTVKANTSSEELKSSDETSILESKLVKFTGFNHPKVAKKLVAKVAPKSNTNRYTIQLVASHKVNDVHRFRKSQNLQAKTKVRHFTNAKGTWYVLTLGEYTSRNEAQLKAKKLSADLAKLNPWIRPTSGLASIG